MNQQELWAEAYRRNILTPEKKAVYEEAMRRGLVQGPERTLGQRFLDNLEDGFGHSGAGYINRQFLSQGADATAGQQIKHGLTAAPRLIEGGLLDRGLDAVFGNERGFARGQERYDSPAAREERIRRERYDARAAADPIQNPADFAAFLGGQIVGGGVSPESWAGGGAAKGASLSTRLLAGASKQGAIAGATDAILQANDIGAGIQDEYSAAQTAGAVALASGLSTAIDAARPISRFVRDAFTAKVEPMGAPAQQASPGVAPNSPETRAISPETPAAPGVEGGAQRAAASPAQAHPRPEPSSAPFIDGEVRSVADMAQFVAERRNPEAPNPHVGVRFDAGDMHPNAKGLLDSLAPGFGDTPSRVRINGRALAHVDNRRPERLDRLTSEIESIVQRPDEIWPNVSAANAGKDPWARPWLVRSKGTDGTAVVVEVAPGADGIDVVTVISPLGKKQRARAERLLATEGRHAAETAVPSYPPSAAKAGRSPDAFPIVGASEPNVTPEFGIVQRVERKSPWRDLADKFEAGEVPQIVGEWLGKAYTAVVSDQHPLIRAVESLRSETEALTGAPMDLLPSQDPRKLARGRFDWAAIGHQDLLHGVHAYGGLEPTTPALADVISAVAVRAKRAGEAAEDAIQRFNEYMVARRSLTEWDRHARGELENAPVARTKDQAEAFLTHIDKQHPEFRELSDAVNEYSGGLLKKALDGGLIDEATYKASLANRDFYVPLRRVLDDAPAKGGAGGGKNASAEVKAFKGSERDIVDPLSVLIERTYRLNQRLRQNELNLSLIGLGEKLEAAQRMAGIVDGENGWLRKVETPRKAITVSKDELAAGANRNATPDMLDQMFSDDGVEVWRPGEINDGGRPILYAWRNGERQAWEIVDETWGRDVFEAMSGMSKGMQDTFLNAMAAPTAVLAQTITRDPAFLFSNFIRDQVSAWILTDVGFRPGEGALGALDELRQTDVTRLYGLSGGISGGAATAMLGDALHKADTLSLAQKGIQAKYFSSLGGLLATSEITETGTRLQVFKRAFERAKKEGFSEQDALLEASFTARDLIDFGRSGAKMHMTRRLVTFLNAFVQGLDKAQRVLGADGAMTRVPLKDAIRPLFSMEVAPGQMRAEDRAALQLAGRAWAKVASVATFGAAITALYHDDPDWQQSNERTRATHWTIPWGGNLIKVPKPFELAFLSNIVERGIEATAGQDELAWEKMWRGLGMLFAPPSDIPVVAVVGGLASNTNSMTGRPIVPDHLQNLPPELQYQHWNSGFSQWLGGQIGVSPAKIDYAIQGFAGPIGSYALRGMDASDPDRAEGAWTDAPVVRRFVNPSYRGSQDKREFYDRAGAKSSELRRALNGITEYQKRGQQNAAQAIFADLDEPGKMFVTSQMGATPTRRLHPLERARVFAQEGSRIIGEINGAQPKDQGIPLPPMSRQTRRMVGDAIERVTVAELRNAMIATRQPGFQNREPMDRAGYWQDLRDMAPEVAAELERRLGVGQDRAYDYDAVMAIWPQVEQRLKSEGSTAYLDDLAADAQGRTESWGERLEIEGPEAMAFRF